MADESNTPPPMDDNDPLNDAVEDIKDAATQPPPQAAGVSLGMGSASESDEKTMGMLAHLLGAFTYFIGPLIIWLIKKDESPFVNDQGKEAVNFQILIAIGMIATTILSIPTGGCAGLILYPAIGIANLIFCILACLEANKGKAYRYPFNLRLIS